jgi:predicted dienelactone hydrolase
VLSREPQALEEAAHGGQADPPPSRLLERGPELGQRGIRRLVDDLAHQGQGSGVAARLAAARVGAGGELPGGHTHEAKKIAA